MHTLTLLVTCYLDVWPFTSWLMYASIRIKTNMLSRSQVLFLYNLYRSLEIGFVKFTLTLFEV